MIRVGMVGTFDVANFGDLLFPLVARAELRRRLGDVEIRPYSYQARSAASWPFHVAPLERLPEDAEGLDLLLVGGGDIIRFDTLVALGYKPSSSAIHHPTGFWLAPILVAQVAGVPIAWNAPGVPAPVPAWARALVRASVMASDYVNVRDTASRELLAAVAPDAHIAVVPDSCFDVVIVQDDAGVLRPDSSLDRVDGPYLVVQSCREALGALPSIRKRFQRSVGTFVLTPVGPVTGDRIDPPRGLPPDTVFRRSPDPQDLLGLISGSNGVVGTSLHLTIAALALGRPALRPVSAKLRKYRLLEGLKGVQEIDCRTEVPPVAAAWPAPDPAQISTLRTHLSAHWDRIAACARAGRARGRPPAGERQLMETWQRLPGALERRTPLERIHVALRAVRALVAQSRYNPLRG